MDAKTLVVAFPQWTTSEIEVEIASLPSPLDVDALLARLALRAPTDAQLAQHLSEGYDRISAGQALTALAVSEHDSRPPSYPALSAYPDPTTPLPATIEAPGVPRRRRREGTMHEPLLER